MFNFNALKLLFCLTMFNTFNHSQAIASRFNSTGPYILDFIANNGYARDHLSFVTLDQNDKHVRRMLHYLMSTTRVNSTSVFKAVILTDFKESSSQYLRQNSVSFVAIASTSNPSNWQLYLDMMVRAKIMSGILVMLGEAKPHNLQLLEKMIDGLSKNSMFYMAYYLKNSDKRIIWNRVITLQGYSKSVTNLLKFDSNGKIIEHYDMQGTHIINLSLSWKPYLRLYGCNEFKKQCKSDGYLADVMNILGKKMNFTWESHEEVEGNWGLKATSGPSNSSGVWGGVLGSVFKGEYQLTVCSWRMTTERYDMFDYSPVVVDREVLAMMRKDLDMDAWLSVRPFKKESWLLVGITSLVIFIILSVLLCLRMFLHQGTVVFKTTQQIILFTAWMFFLLVQSHYAGALTMFFSTELEIPFSSVRDVIRAYPHWKLMTRSGLDIFYINHVEAGDPDYIKFWDRFTNFPEETSYRRMEDVLHRHHNNRVVFHDWQTIIDAYSKYGMEDVTEKLDIFFRGRSEWLGLMVTKNSPLGPMLKRGTKLFYERGVLDNLKNIWLTGSSRCRSLPDKSSSTMVLNMSHVGVAFYVFAFSIFVCFLVFVGELFWRKHQETFVVKCVNLSQLEIKLQQAIPRQIKLYIERKKSELNKST